MDSKFFFEIEEAPTEITEVDKPTRLDQDIVDKYRLYNEEIQKIYKQNTEASYIILKF